MKHASDATLDQIEQVLTELRQCKGIKEKKRGIFYRKSKAFLHFHEDPAGIFADIRDQDDWERLPIKRPLSANV
ncbi:MAG: hypothetical protein ACFE0J_05800 [Elainellaceae cyanobacterium]